MRHPWSGLAGLPRGIWVLFAVSFVNRLGTMFLPFLVLYLTRHLGFTPGNAAAMIALYGAVGIAVGPLAGRLADHWGAERVMKLSLFSSGALLVLFPLARSHAGVAAMTVAIAVTAEAFRPANLSLATHVVPAENRKAAFSLLRLAINLGMSFGPAAGGFLAAISFPALFWVDGATSLLAGLVLLVRPVGGGAAATAQDAPARPGNPLAAALSDGRYLYFLAAALPVILVFFQHVAALPLFLVRDLGRSPSTFGLLFSLNTLLIVLLEVPLNLATAGVPHHRTLFSGALLIAAGFGLYALPGGLPAVVLGTVVWTFGEMILLPGLSSFVADAAPAALRGTYMGLYSMTFSVGFALGPWLGTQLLDRRGATVLWVSMFALGAISAALLARVRTRSTSLALASP
jgi:predicted MFS family arabinose efflux permease